jgi:hypothetical protein
MASKLGNLKRKQTEYLAAYFGLLFFSLSGFMLRGGVLMFIGVGCWLSVVACLFLFYKGGIEKNFGTTIMNNNNLSKEQRERF